MIRQTIRALQRYTKDNGGFVAATRKVARLAWLLLRTTGFAGLFTEVRQTLKARQAQVALLQRKKILATLAQSKQVAILTTPHAMFVAHMLNHGLARRGFRVSIITSPPSLGYGDAIYLVISPQMFARLPMNMIAFQMEQSTSTRWFTPRYLDQLRNAVAILDYSRINIDYLTRQGIPYGNIFYLPIAPVPDYLDLLSEHGLNLDRSGRKDYDVLFYGDVNNERRRTILGKLGERFNVTIVGNLFGRELYDKLLRARVVVNIHYYENALLETTRISECLSLGVSVVSESSSDRSDYPELEARVRYVKVGDVGAMIDAIESLLSDETDPAAEAQAGEAETVGATASAFYLDRFLLAFGLTDFETMSSTEAQPPRFSTGRICLSLPETMARRNSFLAQGQSAYELFDGMRGAQGWIGCGLSYKYLLQRAKRAGLPRLLICEDDVVLTSAAEDSLAVVYDYLDSIDGQWDVFAGLIAHLHPDVTVSRVAEHGGLTFAHLDKMTSMVFNIYNRSIYDLLIAWDESDENPRSNTVDRYLESRDNLRVVTAVPFIVGHSEDDTSTLWGFGNRQYVELISRSQLLLQSKVDAVRAQANAGGSGQA
ncbi:methyltransferase type 11 [Ramlibacter sp. WS9]|uniref:methyltransferase type 11 n=1 Tax=Ramlibacter sp. WS9 TaxID=1882741 RepID=UPI0011449607|nr:methyltransferase type 11 [Ramlibacter sp. WS9]ROZ79132.1 methyltransferase type 11 [Ramlibacter sp. WS9]